MRLIVISFLLFSIGMTGQNLRLSKPKVSLEKHILSTPVDLEASFAMHGAKIYYNVEKNGIVSKYKAYKKPLKITEPTTIRFQVKHHDYLSSPEVMTRLIAASPFSYYVDCPEAQGNYKAQGCNTLSDNICGSSDFHQNYLGYNASELWFKINLDLPTKVEKVVLSTLVNQGAWIFGAMSVDVYDQNEKLVGSLINSAEKQTTDVFFFPEIKLLKGTYTSLNIKVKPTSSIPDWHQGKGNPAWFFIDEILVY
jgi:hypothetical protein